MEWLFWILKVMGWIVSGYIVLVVLVCVQERYKLIQKLGNWIDNNLFFFLVFPCLSLASWLLDEDEPYR